MKRTTYFLNILVLLLLAAIGAQAQNSNKLYVPDLVGEEEKPLTVPVLLSNTSTDIVAMQFNLAMPEAALSPLTPTATLTERKADHTIVAAPMGGGRYKIMVYSPTNTPFKAQEGAVVNMSMKVNANVDATATFAIELSDVVLSDAQGRNVATASQNGTFKIQPSADFVVKDIKADATTCMPGDSINLAWTVSNIGNMAATGGWSERVLLIDANGNERHVGTFYHYATSLAMGSSVSRSGRVALPLLPGIAGYTKISVTLTPAADAGEDDVHKRNNTSESASAALNIGSCLYLRPQVERIEEGTAATLRFSMERSANWNAAQTFALTLTRGDGRMKLPASVSIPKGQSAAYFYATLTDNAVLDGDSLFVIEASGNGYSPVQATFVMEDDELPQLSMTASASDITEGDTFTLTITTERASGSPITVNLTSEAPGRFRHPATATIPAGETATTVEVTAIDNDEVELQASIAFTASAERHYSGECIVVLNDNDLPAISLQLTPQVVSEDAGLQAIVAHLSRTGGTEGKITIKLSDDSKGDIYYPTNEIVMEKGVKEAQFSLGVKDNAIVDGNRKVNITAAVYVSSCSCSASGCGAGSVTSTIEITDNDGPALGIKANSSTLPEGREVTLSISRNTDVSEPLTVSISISPDDGIAYGHTLTIPANKKTATTTVKASMGAANGTNKTLVITAQADGHAQSTCWVMLTDQTLPDAQVADISLSKSEVMVGNSVDVNLTISNTGAAELPDATKVGLYISTQSTPIATTYTPQSIGVGEQISLSRTITLPESTGSYSIYAVVNDGQAVKELLYTNNTSGKVSVKVTAPFTATVSTDKAVYQQGEKVVLSGNIAGGATSGKEVEVYVINNGLRQTLVATTNENGSFTTTYQPYANMMGHFTVGACYPGESLKTAMAAFDIYGMKLTTIRATTCETLPGETFSSVFEVENPGTLPLTGVMVKVIEKPENCNVSIDCPTTIEGKSTIDIGFNLTSNAVTTGNAWEEVKLQIKAAEDPSLTKSLYFYCRNPKAQLQASVGKIQTTMIKGASRDYPLAITNIGKGGTGKITLSTLPEWMSLATPREMASLAQNDTATIILRFTPTEDMQLNVAQKGTIGINCENGDGIALGYEIETVSESTGTLVIDVCDDNTYNTSEAPHVSGAQVVVKHPVTQTIVVQGVTNENGIYEVTLPEGYYKIDVTSEKHNSYSNNILVDPERETRKVVNLTCNAIGISYVVKRTEIEDEYNIETVLEYETNVPQPVVLLSFHWEDSAKELLIITLTNKGDIRARDVEVFFPNDLKTFRFDTLGDYEPFNIAPQQSATIPVRVTKVETEGGEKDPCYTEIGTRYFWDCGLDHKWHYYAVPLQVGECSKDDITYLPTYDPNRRPGHLGPDGPSSLPPSTPNPTPDGDETLVMEEPPLIVIDEDCEPCENGIRIAGMKCKEHFISSAAQAIEESLKNTGYDGNEEIPEYFSYNSRSINSGLYSLIDVMANAFRTCVKEGAGYAETYECYNRIRNVINDMYDEVLSKMGDVTDMDKAKKIGKQRIIPLEIMNIVEDCIDDFAHACDHLKNGSASNQSASPSSTKSNSVDFIQSVMNNMEVCLTDLKAFGAINDLMWGTDMAWNDVSMDEMDSLMDIDYLSTSYEAIKHLKPQAISENEFSRFYQHRKDCLSGNMSEAEKEIMRSSIATMHNTMTQFQDLGYDTPSEYAMENYGKVWEMVNESQNSVCASITLQLSQKMVMTREAFRGILTVFNGNEETAMENVRMNIEIRDEDGTLAETPRQFQVNTEKMTGFEGELDLQSGWKIAPNDTGTVSILFIPTKYAAPTESKTYYFGGSLTYIDPFTNLEVTRTLFPTPLAVSPSPNLNLTYFMQRDVFGDDPFTPEVVEPSQPAEFALLISNKGYGDAKNLRLQTKKPQITENEKGLLIDLDLISAQLNGTEKNVTLSGEVITTDFGTIPAHGTAYAQWWLQSSLLGHFTDYDVKVNHLTGYGNEDLSLIDNASIHELIHGFTAEDNAEMPVRGFLVNDIADADDAPDMAYFTDGRLEEGVSAMQDMQMTRRTDTEYAVTLTPTAEGWAYGSTTDLTNGRQQLVRATRQSDGKEVPTDNFWLTDRTLRDGRDPLYENRLHAVARLTGPETFILTFTPKPEVELEVEAFEGLPADDAPLTTALPAVVVRFNKIINAATFTTDDIALTCQGKQIDASKAVITQTGNTTFSISLSDVALSSGYCTLTVQTAGITDSEGFAGRTARSASWTWFANGLVSISVKAEPEEGGSTSPASCAVPVNSKVTLKATPAQGYSFEGWQRYGETCSTEPQLTFMAEGDEQVTALFALKNFYVNVDYDALMGNVEGAATGIYAYGTILSMKAVPAADYTFAGWLADGLPLTADPALSLTVTSDVTLTAEFEQKKPVGLTPDATLPQLLRLHPLPLAGEVRIDGNFSTIRRLAILDLSGGIRLSASNLPAGASVDVQHLPAGFYIVSVHTDNGTFTRKVLKK